MAISFFTFQQVGYLVDCYREGSPRYQLLDYSLFVSFFPQLIAGPIVRHAEMMPQFRDPERVRPSFDRVYRGVLLFTLGLGKKVILADSLSPFVAEVFSKADGGQVVGFVPAWAGALAYTFQLYFDFRGYVDMALGAALLFGITLPTNFNAPYKAHSIIDFWRRWHITLSRFLRDYLYIPVGGNRRGRARRHFNLMLTMLLGGLWHGAGWPFVLWGGLHGVYLLINHGWRALTLGLPPLPPLMHLPARVASWALTFLAVVVAWVFFRATSVEGAFRILRGMGSFEWEAGWWPQMIPQLPEPGLLLLDFNFLPPGTLIALCFAIAVLCPRGEDLVRRAWARHPLVALAVSPVLLIAIWRIVFSGVVSEFLYFDF